MSDLIDLSSPNGSKAAAGAKLSSPLIPAPAQSGNDGNMDNHLPPTSSGLNYITRDSLDNNPFDSALHKTVEYLSKHEDPFEIVLEKALKFKEQNVVTTPKARCVEFKDDFTPKRTRYSDILKMNKTLDDSLIQVVASAEESIIHDLNNTNLLGGSSEGTENEINSKFKMMNGHIVPKLIVDSHNSNDTSILNQSAMNDSLTECSSSSEERLIKSIVAQRISMCIKRGTNEFIDSDQFEDIQKSRKYKRSLSQGDRMSPRKFRQQRSRSIVDSLKANGKKDEGLSVATFPSIIFENDMDKAFLLSQHSGSDSTASDLSNISAITRLTSLSSAINSSSVCSNRTANCAFIESSTNTIPGTRSKNDKNDDHFSSIDKLSSTGSIASILSTPLKEHVEISDLASKFSQLKARSLELSTSELPITRLPSLISHSENFNRSTCENAQDKLIDVDVFELASEKSPPFKSAQKTSVSSTSSDSVFLDSTPVGKDILAEAKSLAQTFEELAAKTVSSSASSIGDDLINSRTHWNFDLLPSSEDEVQVNNLIELPNSPAKDERLNSESSELKAINQHESLLNGEIRSEKVTLKELELEFIAPEKKAAASTLLLELEQLVKSEGNPAAVKLLENLEKALGVNCQSNSELLATCFADKNDLTKVPKRSENAPVSNENLRSETTEKSCEDNFDVESSDSLRQLSLSESKSLHHNLNNEKEVNRNEESLALDENFEEASEENIAKEMHVSNEKIHECGHDSISEIMKQNQITDDQKMAVEILVGLGKLLTGEKKDPMTANVLKNLEKALNLATSSHRSVENDVHRGTEELKRANTPVKSRIATPPRKSAQLSTFSRSVNRRSLESSTKPKPSAERVIRRSVSVIQAASSTTPAVQGMPVDKSKVHLREVNKRFSSDPGLVGSTAERKKTEYRATNKRKTNVTKDVSLNAPVVSELTRKEQPSSTIVETVKSKLRKKTDAVAPSKKGPMKALLPLGNMQRRGSLGKKVSPSSGSLTPPKPSRETPSAFTVTTSTPYPIVNLSCPKKSPKTKPMASSTPDAILPKESRRSMPHIQPSPGKNTFSCNISPVTSKTGESDDNNASKDNSKSLKPSKLSTPSKPRSASQLPKLSPMLESKRSPNKSIHRRSEPFQSSLSKSQNSSKSPKPRVGLGNDGSSSPLKNSNKLVSKVKPLNLISKLRRRSENHHVGEKENNCA